MEVEIRGVGGEGLLGERRRSALPRAAAPTTAERDKESPTHPLQPPRRLPLPDPSIRARHLTQHLLDLLHIMRLGHQLIIRPFVGHTLWLFERKRREERGRYVVGD